MEFLETVRNNFKPYGAAIGRACRSEFWYWELFTMLVALAAGIIDYALFPSMRWDKHGPVDLLTNLFLFLPSVALAIRRLHDVNRKGYWLLISLTLVGLFFPLLYWFCKKGTDGDNQYGPDPLAR